MSTAEGASVGLHCLHLYAHPAAADYGEYVKASPYAFFGWWRTWPERAVRCDPFPLKEAQKSSRLLSIIRRDRPAAGAAVPLPPGAVAPVAGGSNSRNLKVPGPVLPPQPGAKPRPAEIAKAPDTGNVPVPPRAQPVRAERRRLVFAVDATASRASRAHAWEAAKRLTDTLLDALPGELDVAFAVHSGGKLDTFTGFTSNAGKLRDMAAGVQCRGGFTRLLDIMHRVAALREVGVLLYIGDCFEESERKACKLADTLGERETRVIILHDGPPPSIFREIAERSGGALLPFDIRALDELRALLAAVAVLAVEGVEAVEAKAATMPAAKVLLQNLDPKRLLNRTYERLTAMKNETPAEQRAYRRQFAVFVLGFVAVEVTLARLDYWTTFGPHALLDPNPRNAFDLFVIVFWSYCALRLRHWWRRRAARHECACHRPGGRRRRVAVLHSASNRRSD